MSVQRVVVAGTGFAELAAAFTFASIGLRVVVLRAPADDDAAMPLTPVTDPEGTLSSWITSVTAPLTPASPAPVRLQTREPTSRWLRNAKGWVREPQPSVLGIPASPLATEVSSAIGTGAAMRAYLDRVTPLLTIGKTTFLGELVRKRMGQKIVETWVDPITRHLTGRSAAETPVALVAPGLNEALTRAGSLSGAALAYTDRYARLINRVEPEGGWAAAHEALLARLTHLGAEVVDVAEPPVATWNDDSGRWRLRAGEWQGDAAVLVRAEEAVNAAHRHAVFAEVDLPSWWPDPACERALIEVTTQAGAEWSIEVQATPGVHASMTALSLAPSHDEALGHDAARLAQSALSELFAAAELQPLAASVARTRLVPVWGAEAQLSTPAVEATGRQVRVSVGGGSAHLAQAVADAQAHAIRLRRELIGLT